MSLRGVTIRKLLVANRGEIAVRIIRSAREMGIGTAQVYSDADADMPAVGMADEAVNIGPPQAARSYLNRDAVSGGGFAVIGTVISADMDLIGQLQPNMEARFVVVSMEEALAARKDRQQLLDRARQYLMD